MRSTNLAYPVSSEKYSGTCVSTDPVAEPAVMSFTVPSTGSTVVAAATVETTYSESADCTDSSTSMCNGGVRVATQCGGGSFTPDGAYDFLWDSVKPKTGEYAINHSQCQEDVRCVCMLNDWISSNDEIARRCCVACVEILGRQARTPITRSSHEHAVLESRCSPDSELAATEVKLSVEICEKLQLVSMWCASRHSLRSCNAYVVVVNTRVLFPCEAGAPCGRINEKLSVEMGSLGMTCKLEVTAVGLCRLDVRICDEFCRVWSNGSDIWKWVNVRNLFAWCGSLSCLVSKVVDSEGIVFCVKNVKTVQDSRKGGTSPRFPSQFARCYTLC